MIRPLSITTQDYFSTRTAWVWRPSFRFQTYKMCIRSNIPYEYTETNISYRQSYDKDATRRPWGRSKS